MKELSGKDKIQKICDAIRKETIEPAKQQRKEILENAVLESKHIIEEAYKKKEEILKEAEKESQEMMKRALGALKISSRKVMDSLKQEIEKSFFSKNLLEEVQKNLKDPKIIAKVIDAIIKGVEKESLDTDFSIYISKEIDKKDLLALLGKNILDKLKEKEFLVGDFTGVRVKLYEKDVIIDMTDKAFFDLISSYLREDFIKMLFS